MFVRILRFALVAGVGAAVVVLGTPLNLLSTPTVESKVHQVSAKDLQITCTGPTFIAGGLSRTKLIHSRWALMLA
jgi:hypothetical protein